MAKRRYRDEKQKEAEGQADQKAADRAARKKRGRKNIAEGVVHIHSTFNNTIVTITDYQGNVISWSSAGSMGFKGSRKGTPFAAQQAADSAAKKAMDHGLRSVQIFVRGPGRRARIGAARAAVCRYQHQPDQRCDPDSAQRVPSAKTKTSLIKEEGLARYTESVCRLCRRENLKLFLKGERCYTDKCAIERRNYPPGQHGQKRPKFSEYSIQLREKQKVKRMYGLLENQFRRTFARGEPREGDYRRGLVGFAGAATGQRHLSTWFCQFQSRRHDYWFGTVISWSTERRVNIPSYFVRVGDEVSVKEQSRQMTSVLTAMEGAQRRGVPEWAEVDRDAYSGRIKLMPTRSDITMPINEKLIVELYSK